MSGNDDIDNLPGTLDDDELDAPDPARLLAGRDDAMQVGATATGAFRSLADNLAVMQLPEDPDTEDTPPTAVPGEFDFRFDWDEDEEGAVADTYDGSELDDDGHTFDGAELDDDRRTFDGSELDDAGADEVTQASPAVPHPAMAPAATPAPDEVPAWMIAVSFFVLGILFGQFVLP